MKRLVSIAILTLAAAVFANSVTGPKPELLAQLNTFLAAASHMPPSAADKATFNNFFADDVVYTRASGLVINKADIMRSLDQPPSPTDPIAIYSAEDVTIHSYGDVAIIAFRLVQKLPGGATHSFRNTGTFLKRDRRWQAIAWQATPIPEAQPR